MLLARNVYLTRDTDYRTIAIAVEGDLDLPYEHSPGENIIPCTLVRAGMHEYACRSMDKQPIEANAILVIQHTWGDIPETQRTALAVWLSIASKSYDAIVIQADESEYEETSFYEYFQQRLKTISGTRVTVDYSRS